MLVGGTDRDTDTDLNALIDLTKKLLISITSGDWDTYTSLVSDHLTCFEPEAGTHLVTGLDFHQFYFGLGGDASKVTTLVNPIAYYLSADKTSALVAYVRLTQFKNKDGVPVTTEMSETRIWGRSSSTSNDWKNVHFHRGVGKL
ncbi:hypothetical protein HDU99_003909 [Rhizoclosmatium hyalinum]|nr:hypothetical protein HDU99_003909 [Rhizoclosmatium hyalinum]